MSGRRSPDGLAADLAAALSKPGVETVKRHVSTVVAGAGWKNRSRQNVHRIATALAAAGVHSDIDLTDLSIPPSTWVRFSFTPFPRPSRQFPYEQGLSVFLTRHHREMFDAIPELAGAELLGREQSITHRGKRYRIDLLFRAANGTKVIVELKRGECDADAIAEVQKYSKALMARGDQVRAVMITARPVDAVDEENIRELLAGVACPVSWYWYDVDVRFEKLV